MMPRVARLLARTGAATAAVVVVAGLFLLWYLRQSLPALDGEQQVVGLSAPVDIIRGVDAIPHVFASSKHDALFGLGYVHAQDRLWQMELQRRIGFGRLSEIFGEVTVPQDRFLRTVGFGRAARSAWEHLPAHVQAQVDAYVAGVNAFISTHHGRQLPPEFSVFRFEPEPWTGPDVVVWQKMLAWDLSANYALELFRDDLARTVGEDRMRQLMPAYADDGLSILGMEETRKLSARARRAGPSSQIGITNHKGFTTEDTEDAEDAAHTDDTTRRHLAFSGGQLSSGMESLNAAVSNGLPAVRDLLLGGGATEAVGSNNWVVDGTLTASGKPLLANDPHLGTRVPSSWYLAHMSAGDFDVEGATLPGTPAVALGRNRFIAWGATNALVDVEDLYRERIDRSGRFAEFRGSEEPISVVRETIAVRGAAPVRIDVRITRHGPLVSDAINANTPGAVPLEPLAFRWTALDPEDPTLAAFLELNEARDWEGFTSALRDFVVPSQNFVYADTAGHIGYYTPGHIPQRAEGDGPRPVEGWTGTHEWTGWIPFDQLPHVFDPPAHFVVTANDRQEAAGYPFDLGMDWQEPLRATRITELIRSGRGFTADDFARIQADTLSVQSRLLLPRLLAHVRGAEGSEGPEGPESSDARAIALLRAWNGDARGDSAAAAIFAAWLQHVVPAVAGDDLGPVLVKDYQDRFSSVSRFLVHTLDANDESWCDDGRTPQRETCDETVTRALHAAVLDLTARMGADPSRWRWDRVHRAIFPHQGLDSVALLRPLLGRSIPNGGDWSTVNVGVVAPDRPYEQHSVAGYREIVDLSPADDSRFMIDLGESGHPLSPHYDDFLKDWQQVRYRRIPMDRAAVEKNAAHRLRLTVKSRR
jgi:penicillin G amidase